MCALILSLDCMLAHAYFICMDARMHPPTLPFVSDVHAGMLVLVVLMATAGKFIGCAGTARINGIPLRESAVIGMYVC